MYVCLFQNKIAKLKLNLEKLRDAANRGIKIRMTVTRKLPCSTLLTTAQRSNNNNKVVVVPLTRLDDKGSEVPVHIPNAVAFEHCR